MAFSVNKSKSIMVRKLCEEREDLTREDLILGNISKESLIFLLLSLMTM
jgi:hypothetical protein